MDADWPAGSVERFALGTVTVVAGASDNVALVLPDDVVGLNLVLVEATPRSLLAVTELRGPGGALVEARPAGWVPSDADRALGPFPGAFHSPNRSVAFAAGVGALHAPAAPGVALVGGAWTLRIGAVDFDTEAPAHTEVAITAWVRRGPSLAEGRLPVHMFVSHIEGLNAVSAPADPRIGAALAHMSALLASAGIAAEVVSWQDVAADGPWPVEGGGALEGLLRTNDHEDGVALFLVDHLTTPFGTEVAGVAGGTPGPSLTPGTGRSGVAIAWASGLAPAAIGRVMAHEVGHFLGLFHTVEPGGFPDPLPDTSEDPADRGNLMVPWVGDEAAEVSPAQGVILRADPAVEAW